MYAMRFMTFSSLNCPWNVGITGGKPLHDVRLGVEDRFAQVGVVGHGAGAVLERHLLAAQPAELRAEDRVARMARRASLGGEERLAHLGRRLLR